MKILFNTMGLGKGGAERVISLLANSFVDYNEIVIVTNIKSNVEYEFNKKIRIVQLVNNDSRILRKIRRISIYMVLKLRKIILNYNPDIIISFLPEPSFRVLALKKHSKKIKNIPVIVSVRNDPNTEYNNKVFYFIMKRLYPHADQLILQTNDSKKYFEDNIKQTGIVIQNPVSDIFLTERYDGEREKKIVAVGRLEPQKNYKNLIEAFEIVNKKYNDYILEIYGEGFLKEELQKYIEYKKLNDKVLLKGKVDDVKKVIYKATAFVMSSDYEGMPNSLLEAACLGVPCVSTDCPCGGPREILDNGNSGCLVPVNNPKKLADGIIKLINDIEYANKISDNAKNNSSMYSKEEIIKKWKEIINKTIKESKK